MTNKTTKRALLMSMMALFLCFTMLLGTTFAWFTDSAATGSNVITSGNLDIEVSYTLDGTTWNGLDGATDLFQKGLWEPGHTEVVALKIENKGTLALKYSANMKINSETVGKTKDNTDITLSEILTVSTLTKDNGVGNVFTAEDGETYTNTSDFKSANVLGASQLLQTGETHYVIVKVDMAEDVGNEANHNGTDIPKIDFGINVLATQLTYENDSFGNQYDQDATYPNLVSTVDELNAAIAAGKPASLSADIAYDDSFSSDTVIDLNGHEFEATTTLTLTNNSDLTMTGGDYTVNGTYGHVDVRPSSANGSVVTFENVDFSYTKKGPSYGPSTDRLGSVLEFCATAADAGATIVFKNCTFNNAQVLLEGMSGKTGVFDVTFDSCTFNALTSSAPIYVQNYVTGTLTVTNCTFNLECTSSTASAISVSSSSSTSVTVIADGNTINATAATPTDSSVTGVDIVKVNGTPANIKFISAAGTTTSTIEETNTTKTGIAQ